MYILRLDHFFELQTQIVQSNAILPDSLRLFLKSWNIKSSKIKLLTGSSNHTFLMKLMSGDPISEIYLMEIHSQWIFY